MDPAASTPPGPTRKTTVKRVMAAIVVWLVVGAVLTVLTTWSAIVLTGWCALAWPERSEAVPWPREPGDMWPSKPNAYAEGTSRWSEYQWWVHFQQDGQTPREGPTFQMSEHRAGWPFRGIGWRSAIANFPSGESGLRLGIWNVHRIWPEIGFLPLLPLWPGFALNTLFYAAIAWGLWRGPGLIRRHRRRIRGLCVKCAYNRAGLAPGTACPECGHAPPFDLSATSSNPRASA